MPIEQPEPPANLRQRLMQFTLSEVEAFCHDLGINPQLLRHQKLDEFVLDLLGYCQRRPGFIERLTQLAEQAEAERAIPPTEGECPYKGLSAYEEADAHLFFGREKLTQELLEHLQKHNFLVVVGASGSGKSSVVKAGVIPQLRQNSEWLIVPPFRPGSQEISPFEELAFRLLPLLQNNDAHLDLTEILTKYRHFGKQLAEGQLSLSQLVADVCRHHPQTKRVLLVIDQFEELFTHRLNTEEREQWFQFLVEPLIKPHNKLTILFTLRADFYTYAVQSATLKPWLETAQKIVPLMDHDELREAITKPLLTHQPPWSFQEGLVDTILEDIAQEPGGLPFLSQALLKTWEKRQGRLLTLRGYVKSGGVKEAIAQTAEQVYTRLPEPLQQIVKELLLRLTQLGEGREDTRRRMTYEELTGLHHDPTQLQAVLQELTSPYVRLLSQDKTHIEVAHEAVIRGWPRLRDWLDNDREGLRLHRQLTEEALNWERLGRDKSVLWRGVRLAQMQEWGQGQRNLTQQERQFLEESLAEEERIAGEQEAQRQKELAAAKQLAEAKENRLRVIRSALGGAILLMLVAFMAAGVAVNFYYETDFARATSQAESTRADLNLATAVYNEQEANEQANISLSLALASASETIGNNNDVMKSFLLGLEAFQISPTNLAFTTLNKSLPYVAKPIFTLQHEGWVDSAQWNRDESHILTSSRDGTAKVWDGQSGELLFTLQHEGGVNSAQWNGDESRILTCDDGTAKVWDGQSGELLFTLQHEGEVTSAQWNGDESRILTRGDGTANVWDGQSGELLLTLQHEGWVDSAQWNRDESRILTSSDGTVNVWDGQSGELLFTLQHEGEGWLSSVQWNGDESRILTSSVKVGTMNVGGDGTANVWDGQNGELLLTLHHENHVNSAQWNGDESRILTSSSDGTAKIWDGQSGEILFTLQHEGGVNSAEWNRDESRILTSSTDGTVKMWDGQSGELLFTLQHGGVVDLAQWNGDESRILTSSGNVGGNGTAKIWDGQSGEIIFTLQHEGGVNSAEWNGNESRILTSSRDGTAKVWDGGTREQLLFTLPHADWINSAEWNRHKSRILTSSTDRTAKVWDGQSGILLFTLQLEGWDNSAQWNGDESRILTRDDGAVNVWDGQSGALLFTLQHGGYVWSAEWNGDESRILTSSKHSNFDGTAKVWDGQSGALLFTLQHEGEVTSAEWNGDESRILTSSGNVGDDGTANVWDGQSGALLFTLQHEDYVTSAGWNRDESRILTSSRDGTMKVWEGQRGTLLFTLQHEGYVTSAGWNRDESRILTSSRDGTTKVWDGQSGVLLFTLQHEGAVTSAEWNGDESHILTSSSDGTAKVWDEQNGALLFTLQHEGEVNLAEWSPAGTQILTTDYKGVARLWDTETGELLLTMEGDGSDIVSTEWSETDSRLWIVTRNGLVRSYYTDPEELIAEACSRATRNFTWEEWQTYLPGRPYRQTCPNLPVHESVPESERP